jgi:protein SCO1/2
MPRCGVIVIGMLVLIGCHRAPTAREYHVVGQILAVDRRAAKVTLHHEDIKDFMPAMTMPYRVKDAELLAGRTPGELVEATLAVAGTDAWITRLTVIGVAPLPPVEAIQASAVPGDTLIDGAFVDQDGRRIRLHEWRGRPLILSFIYTRCPLPDFCPAIESRLAMVQQRIKTDPTLRGTAIVAITIDPGYDTPAVLKHHAAARGADPAIWRFVTGTTAEIDAFGRQFGIMVRRGDGSPNDIEHNLRTIVVSRDGRIVHVEDGAAWRVEDLVGALRRAADRS